MTPISTKIRMAMLMKPMTIDFFRVLPVGGTRWFKWSPCCLWFLCAVALSRFGGFSVLALKIKFTRSTTLEQPLTSLTSQVYNCHRYFHVSGGCRNFHHFLSADQKAGRQQERFSHIYRFQLRHCKRW